MKTFDQFHEARLTADQRRALPNKDFALPGKGEGPKGKQAGSYPIPDEKHARSALSLVSQHGTPEEKATVRAKVKKKFPNIQQESMGGGVPLTPQELEIQKKMSRLNVRLARKRSQQMQKAKVDDTETAPEQVKEGVGDAVKKGLKRHKDAVEKKKIKNRKAVPYAALAAEHQPEGEIIEGKKKGLWDNIHAKRKRGEKPAKPGDKDYPKTLNVEGLEKARKNVGADKCWDGYKAKGTKKKGGKEVPNCVKVDEAKVDKGRSDYGKASIRNYRRSGPGHGEPAMFDPENKRGKTIDKRREEHKARRGVKKAKVPAYKVDEGAAWTKKSGKNPEGGLNEKGRKSYERENPGSDLKAPQPEGGSRKKSFCARMGGMKKKLTSKKTANDPDSRINKSLRKWKCNEEDKAFNFVVSKLKAKYGSGVMTKGDKMPEPSAAQKKKNAAIRAKRAKEDHRDPTEKASDGRYSDRYSNRGSD